MCYRMAKWKENDIFYFCSVTNVVPPTRTDDSEKNPVKNEQFLLQIAGKIIVN